MACLSTDLLLQSGVDYAVHESIRHVLCDEVGYTVFSKLAATPSGAENVHRTYSDSGDDRDRHPHRPELQSV